MQCQNLNEQAADYVLGQLPDEERRQIDEHLARCEACRQLIAATDAAAALLPLGLPAAQPSAALEGRLLDAIEPPATVPLVDPTVAAQAPAPIAGRRSRRSWLWAASLLAVAAGGGAWIGFAVHDPRSDEIAASDRSARRAAAAALQERIEAARQKDQQAGVADLRYVAFEGAADAHGYVAADRATRQWHVLVGGLPELPAGRDYRVWLQTDVADGAPIWTSAGVLAIDEAGSGSLVIDMREASRDATRLVVTDDPPEVDKPTGKAWLAAGL